MKINDLPPLSGAQTLGVSAAAGAGILGVYLLMRGQALLGAPMVAAGLYGGFWYGREVMQYREELEQASQQQQALVKSLAPLATAAQASNLLPFEREGDQRVSTLADFL